MEILVRLRKRFAAFWLCSLERVSFLLLTSHLRGAIPIGKLVTALWEDKRLCCTHSLRKLLRFPPSHLRKRLQLHAPYRAFRVVFSFDALKGPKRRFTPCSSKYPDGHPNELPHTHSKYECTVPYQVFKQKMTFCTRGNLRLLIWLSWSISFKLEGKSQVKCQYYSISFKALLLLLLLLEGSSEKAKAPSLISKGIPL